MKILAIGDFHGKLPEKLKKIAKSEDIDLILSTGDFPDTEKIRKLIFKNWINRKWYEAVGERKAAKLEKESFNSGIEILKELNSLGKKAYIIWGNSDFYENYDKKAAYPRSLFPGNYKNKIKRMKNLILIHKKKKKTNNLEVIGHGGYLDVTDFIKNPIDKEKENQKARIERYKKAEKQLNSLFIKNKPKKGFIFLIHYTPYKIFDKVKAKNNPMRGKNVGFEPYNKIIKKYSPSLVICGHMHEYQGVKKLGSSLILATGAAFQGKAAIIEVDEENRKIKKIKFIQ